MINLKKGDKVTFVEKTTGRKIEGFVAQVTSGSLMVAHQGGICHITDNEKVTSGWASELNHADKAINSIFDILK